MDVYAPVFKSYAAVLGVDREPSFISTSFKQSAAFCGVTPEASGVEEHNAIGVGERYQAPFQAY